MSTRLLVLGAAFCLAVAPAHAEDRHPVTPSPLTTEVWNHGLVLPSPWAITELPGHAFRLALTPLAPIVRAVEVQRLDKHVLALFSPKGDLYFVPLLSYSTGDGLGYGVRLVHKSLLGHDEKLQGQVQSRISGDLELEASYHQDVARWEGRQYRLLALLETDSDFDYYGLGADSKDANRSTLQNDVIELRASVDVTELGARVVTAVAEVAYLRQELGIGQATSKAPAFVLGGPVPPPPGFGDAAHYPELRLAINADTRDSEGRSTRGLLASAEVVSMYDVTGNDLSGTRIELGYQHHIPVLPRFRALILSGGIGAAFPMGSGHEVPLVNLVRLGAKNHLRGYNKSRFLGRYGWWVGAEYRYPLYEYLSSGVGGSAILFGDLGRVGDELSETFGPPKWSVGTGLRVESSTRTLAQFVLGISPEGVEVVAGVKGAL